MKDTFITKGKRRELCEILISKGISDQNVLKAIQLLPRHLFFEPEFENHAYEDKAFPILGGQTISQPYTVAFQTQLLEIQPNNKVLEIGTGSGYQASILKILKAKVYSLEIVPELVNFSKRMFESLNLEINHKLSDGTLGWKEHAPFDKILVTAGAPSIPSPLIDQLRIGGILVIPVGKDKANQSMVKITRSEGGFEQDLFDTFSFVPLTGALGWK